MGTASGAGIEMIMNKFRERLLHHRIRNRGSEE